MGPQTGRWGGCVPPLGLYLSAVQPVYKWSKSFVRNVAGKSNSFQVEAGLY